MMIIDAHQHLWLISERDYSWITPDMAEFYRDFRPEDFLVESENCNIDGSILVQSADSYEDTFYMLSVAQNYDFVKGVVGWIPFDRPIEALAAMETLSSNTKIKGFRNLTHDYSNPKYESDDRWILRDEVMETLRQMAFRNFTLDYVAVNISHIESIIQVGRTIPNLKIVIDHLGKPNIAAGEIEEWKSFIGVASLLRNLNLKLSGLNTVSKTNWRVADWLPYFDFAYQAFGSKRLMIGSDWPVIKLSDTYEKVWRSQLELIAGLDESERVEILGGNAVNFYNLEEKH